MTTTPVESFLSTSMPKYPGPSTFYSASAPKPADTIVQTPESPRSLEYLVTGDTSYRCAYLSFPKPRTIVSSVRPVITAAICISNRDGTMNLLTQYLKGGTVGLLTADGRTITANNVRLEDLKDMSAELGLRPGANGSFIALVRISCDSRDFRSN